jgi:two-component SAPR family response regulator
MPSVEAMNDIPDYIAYCKRMLKSKKLNRHQARSLMEGLKSCGDAGKEMIEKLKKVK